MKKKRSGDFLLPLILDSYAAKVVDGAYEVTYKRGGVDLLVADFVVPDSNVMDAAKKFHNFMVEFYQIHKDMKSYKVTHWKLMGDYESLEKSSIFIDTGFTRAEHTGSGYGAFYECKCPVTTYNADSIGDLASLDHDLRELQQKGVRWREFEDLCDFQRTGQGVDKCGFAIQVESIVSINEFGVANEDISNPGMSPYFSVVLQYSVAPGSGGSRPNHVSESRIHFLTDGEKWAPCDIHNSTQMWVDNEREDRLSIDHKKMTQEAIKMFCEQKGIEI